MYIINCIYYQYVYDLSKFLFHNDNLYYALESHQIKSTAFMQG